LGRFQLNNGGKNASISSYHYKFLREVLEEQFNSENEIIIEDINEGGLVKSAIRILKKYSKGITLDISVLYNDSAEQNFINLLSSQYSAVLVIPENETKLKEAATKWELNYQIIGQVEDEQNICIKLNNKQLTNLPIKKILENKSLFADYDIDESKTQDSKKINISKIKLPKKARDVAWSLITNPNIASKSCINEQYDNMVGIANMNSSFLSDAEVLNLKGTDKALAINLLDKNNCRGSIETVAQIAIAELSRKMVCSGAVPLVTSVHVLQPHLSGSENLINRIKKTAEKLDITADISVRTDHTAKTVQSYFSMLGLIEDKNHHMTMSFKDKGNIIFLIGPSSENLASSEYLLSYHKSETSYLPDFEINIERKIKQTMLDLIGKNLICSAHNVSKGGLFISLVESAMVFGFGFDIITDTDIRTDAFLFGESPGRVIVSVTPNKEDKFIDFMMQKELPFLAIGHVTKGEMRVDDISYGFINDAKKEYNSALKRFLNKDF
jgi:phosphoribosylformylglycinamidine (FGAM) synthase-like enzyme